MGKFKNWIKKNSKFYASDTTAMLTESHPVFTAFEVGVAGMSNAMSINARLIATAVAFGGIGYVYGKGRDFSRKVFKITDETKERKQHFHDIAYTAAFNLVISPPMYIASQLLAGEDLDFKKIAIGTASATAFGAVNGSPMGYSVDAFRDLTGIKECNRKSYPKFIKKQSPGIKKTIATGLVAASIGAMSLIYSANPNKIEEPQENTTHQIIEKPSEEYSDLELMVE